MPIRPYDVATWLANTVSAAGAEGLVVPLDGSLGCAVTVRLCQAAVGGKVVGAAAPDLQGVAESLQLRFVELPLDLACSRLSAALGGTIAGAGTAAVAADREWTRSAGLHQRVQMAAVYFVADSLNYLVAGSLDRTDLTLGSFTRYGDAAADVMPLGHVLKTDVLTLAKDLRVPDSIVERAEGQTLSIPDALSDTGLTSVDLDRYLADGPDAVAPAVALKIERLMRASQRRAGGPQMMEAE